MCRCDPDYPGAAPGNSVEVWLADEFVDLSGAAGIVPIVNYKLANGWYISNGDMVAQYDWESGQLYIPIAFRLGKVLVRDKHTWNFYGEYRTSLIYKGWDGSAVKNSYRINATYSIPVG